MILTDAFVRVILHPSGQIEAKCALYLLDEESISGESTGRASLHLTRSPTANV